MEAGERRWLHGGSEVVSRQTRPGVQQSLETFCFCRLMSEELGQSKDEREYGESTGVVEVEVDENDVLYGA